MCHCRQDREVVASGDHGGDDDLWEIWYRDLANIFQEILNDYLSGKITADEAVERMNRL